MMVISIGFSNSTEFIDNPTLGGPGRPIPGPKRLETADGQRVNFKAPGVFEIVDSGLIVRTVK
jgi:hypothetical protein